MCPSRFRVLHIELTSCLATVSGHNDVFGCQLRQSQTECDFMMAKAVAWLVGRSDATSTKSSAL